MMTTHTHISTISLFNIFVSTVSKKKWNIHLMPVRLAKLFKTCLNVFSITFNSGLVYSVHWILWTVNTLIGNILSKYFRLLFYYFFFSVCKAQFCITITKRYMYRRDDLRCFWIVNAGVTITTRARFYVRYLHGFLFFDFIPL